MKEESMKVLIHRHLGKIAALVILGATLFLGGEYVSYSHPSALRTSTPVAAPAPAVPDAVNTPAPGVPGFTGVAKAMTPAVVNITSKAVRTRDSRGQGNRNPEEFFGFPSPFGPDGPFGHQRPGPQGPMDPREHRGGGMGSGVIVSPDGYVITNNHVVDGSGELTVTLPDKREFKGKVVGTDPKTDLAVVKIEARNLPYANWGDSTKLQVGEYVLAIGNPFGLNSTVTLGIVSALGRGRMGITQYEDFIQTDAAINPGNSGGALVNTNGELVGINTAIISQSGGYQGVGFAVPASMARPVFDSLVKNGKVVRGFLGIGIQDLNQDLAKSFGLKETKGALVSNVAEESPAEKAGIKQGDVVVGYQHAAIDDAAALQRAVTRTAVGTKALVKVIRNGHEEEVTATIGEQTETKQVARAESGSESALAGVEVQGLNQQMARELGLHGNVHGVVVVNVEPDSQADRVGLAQGDVIREINRHPVKSVNDYEKIVSGLKKDQNALLLINRRGSSLFITVTA
jgi:serine protease Do